MNKPIPSTPDADLWRTRAALAAPQQRGADGSGLDPWRALQASTRALVRRLVQDHYDADVIHEDSPAGVTFMAPLDARSALLHVGPYVYHIDCLHPWTPKNLASWDDDQLWAAPHAWVVTMVHTEGPVFASVYGADDANR